MSNHKSNGKAGSSCTTCETPPQCFHQYTVKDSQNKVILDFPLTHNTKASFITILQSFKSMTYNFELKGNCQNGREKCPMVLMPDSEKLFGNAQKSHVLKYSDDYNWSNMTLLRWLKEFFVFDTKQLSNSIYILPVMECQGLVHIPTLAIYPTNKLSVKFTYGKEVSAAKIEDRRHRYQYTDNEVNQLRKELGKNWAQINRELVKVESSNVLSGEAEIGGFKEKLSFKFGETERYSDDNPIFKITSLISKVSDSLMSKKGHLGPVRDIQLIGPNLEFSGVKELKQNGSDIYFEYSLNGGFAPLIGVKAIIDLVDVVLNLIPGPGTAAAKAWRELRTAMENSKRNFNKNKGKGGYIVAGVDLILTGEIGNGTVSIYNDADNKPAGRGDCGGKITAEIVGYVKGEGKIWIVKGSINTSIKAETGVGASLLVDSKGIATCWEHDGANIVFKGELVAEARSRSKRKISYAIKPIILPLAKSYKSEPYYIFEFNS